jgi:DNA-binding MarR family transcriptional regulator
MSDARWVEALDAVLELTVLLSADMSTTLAADGLTPSRAHLLWVLREHGPSSQRELAEALGVSARNVTGLVDALEQTGFVARRPHPGDRRAVVVAFTDRGAAAVEQMATDQQELARQLFDGLPDLDAVLAGLGEVLARLRPLVAQEGEASRA